jgi:hypothetical protein
MIEPLPAYGASQHNTNGTAAAVQFTLISADFNDNQRLHTLLLLLFLWLTPA